MTNGNAKPRLLARPHGLKQFRHRRLFKPEQKCNATYGKFPRVSPPPLHHPLNTSVQSFHQEESNRCASNERKATRTTSSALCPSNGCRVPDAQQITVVLPKINDLVLTVATASLSPAYRTYSCLGAQIQGSNNPSTRPGNHYFQCDDTFYAFRRTWSSGI